MRTEAQIAVTDAESRRPVTTISGAISAQNSATNERLRRNQKFPNEPKNFER